MPSKRALAIKREKLARKQLSFNERLEATLDSIEEKLDKILEAGLDPEPAELAEVTEPPQEKEAPEKKSTKKKQKKKVVEPELEHDSSEEDDGERAEGW